jgi:hypothetical protein
MSKIENKNKLIFKIFMDKSLNNIINYVIHIKIYDVNFIYALRLKPQSLPTVDIEDICKHLVNRGY